MVPALLLILLKKNLIVEERSDDYYAFLKKNIPQQISIVDIYKDKDDFNIQNLPGKRDCIVNLELLNNVKYLNKYLFSANNQLSSNGVLVTSLETIGQRKLRILKSLPWGVNHLYYGADFVFKRIFPKFKATEWFYNWVTDRRNHPISKSEALGRLVYAGFRIVNVEEADGVTNIVARREKEPCTKREPSKGFLLKINRVGYKGKLVKVYKLRTMHPYAEYLQQYVYEQNQLQEGGKFKNDFRITSWGRFFRKLFIDEFPMMINFFKGELHLVGVRPLSEHYLSLYPQDLIDKRKGVKPGLIPPFYVDLPSSLDEIIESERKYLDSYSKSPMKTKFKYFSKAMFNIVCKGAKSN